MPHTILHIPQPCQESWDAMTPTGQGRHCAACQKTVVDFTLKTDAEILAFLARAAGDRTCGRFAAGQLARPLQRAVPVAPAARWRAWLAAVALWAVREGTGMEAKAQTPAMEWRARYWGGPVPAVPPAAEAKYAAERANELMETRQILMGDTLVAAGPVAATTAHQAAQALVLRGVVTDASTNEGLPGASILVKGTRLGTSTTSDGRFELVLPGQLPDDKTVSLVISFVGYATEEQLVALAEIGRNQKIQLQTQTMGLLAVSAVPPAPWHPRSFYYWGKYWLTRPFRRG